MKKCLLLTLTVLAFTSISHAAPEVSCGDGPTGAGLFIYSGRLVATLHDHFDTAQRSAPRPHGGFGLKCNELGASVECVGIWESEQAPAKVVFTTDASGNISATFARSPYKGGEIVTIACVARETGSN